MPRRYKTGRRKARRGRRVRVSPYVRRYRKKGTFAARQGPSTAIIKQPSGLPDRLHVKLVYREQFSSAQSPGSNLAELIYQGNSPFDPAGGAGSGQPELWTEWSAMYQRYLCTGSKIDVVSQLNNASTGPNTGMTMITHSPYIGGYASINAMMEDPYCRRKAIKANYIGTGMNRQVYSCSTAKALNRTQANIRDDNDFTALVTANPAIVWYWHVGNFVPGSNDQSLIVDVKITYYVTFYNRIRPVV